MKLGSLNDDGNPHVARADKGTLDLTPCLKPPTDCFILFPPNQSSTTHADFFES